MDRAEAIAMYVRLLRDIQAEFPDFEMIPKQDSKFMRTLDMLLKIITFGKMTRFMTSFVTTYGDDIYTPDGWDDRHPISKIITLRHERVHIRQKQRYFRRIKWLSFWWFSFRYMFWILPAGLAMGRKLYEQEAYGESLRARAELMGLEALDDQEYRDHVIGHFLSANYFWTWPFRKSIEDWYDSTVLAIKLDLRHD